MSGSQQAQEEKKKEEEIPKPIQQLMQAFQTVNDNVKNLSDMVNQHTEGMRILAEEIGHIKESMAGAAPQAGAPAPNGKDDSLMHDLIDTGKFLMQRNQPNPWMDMFQDWMKGIMGSSAQLMQANANMNNSIAEAVRDSMVKKVATDVGSKISKVMMTE